jgi:hypothetical protein
VAGVRIIIFVDIDCGHELDELHDVSITTPLDNDILQYNTLTSLWENTNTPIFGNTTISGELIVTENVTSSQQFAPTNIATITPTGATATIDLNTGNVQVLDLSAAAAGDVTVTLSNMLTGGSYVVKVIQHATVPVNVIFTGVLWSSGTAPTISIGANAIDIISLIYDGSTMYGTYVQDFS